MGDTQGASRSERVAESRVVVIDHVEKCTCVVPRVESFALAAIWEKRSLFEKWSLESEPPLAGVESCRKTCRVQRVAASMCRV